MVVVKTDLALVRHTQRLFEVWCIGGHVQGVSIQLFRLYRVVFSSARLPLKTGKYFCTSRQKPATPRGSSITLTWAEPDRVSY